MTAPRDPSTGGEDPRLFRVVLDDLKRGDLSSSVKRDLRDLHRFYLTEDERDRLKEMGRVRRFFSRVWWIFKTILLRLSPVRRLMLVVAIILLFQNISFNTGRLSFSFGTPRLAFLILLIVLMLELKDKLLARDEIEVARQVQLSLLPRRHPSIEGWTIWGTSRPANDVGGDLVDYLHPDGENLGIALGDVAGKGMGAALLSAKLQATLRALATECSSLDDLAARLNAILYRDGLENRYATMFYCEIGPRSGMLRYVNAGHNPPLLLRADGSTTLGPSSLPLGMLPSAAYREEAVELRSGELLLIYSDGLTEATDADGKEFGEGRLRKVVESCRDRSPREIAEAILEEVGAFLGEERPHDDLSLTILQRT